MHGKVKTARQGSATDVALLIVAFTHTYAGRPLIPVHSVSGQMLQHVIISTYVQRKCLFCDGMPYLLFACPAASPLAAAAAALAALSAAALFFISTRGGVSTCL